MSHVTLSTQGSHFFHPEMAVGLGSREGHMTEKDSQCSEHSLKKYREKEF